MADLDSIAEQPIRAAGVIGREATTAELGITSAKRAVQPVITLRIIQAGPAEHRNLCCARRRCVGRSDAPVDPTASGGKRARHQAVNTAQDAD